MPVVFVLLLVSSRFRLGDFIGADPRGRAGDHLEDPVPEGHDGVVGLAVGIVVAEEVGVVKDALLQVAEEADDRDAVLLESNVVLDRLSEPPECGIGGSGDRAEQVDRADRIRITVGGQFVDTGHVEQKAQLGGVVATGVLDALAAAHDALDFGPQRRVRSGVHEFLRRNAVHNVRGVDVVGVPGAAADLGTCSIGRFGCVEGEGFTRSELALNRCFDRTQRIDVLFVIAAVVVEVDLTILLAVPAGSPSKSGKGHAARIEGALLVVGDERADVAQGHALEAAVDGAADGIEELRLAGLAVAEEVDRRVNGAPGALVDEGALDGTVEGIRCRDTANAVEAG